VPPKSPGSMAKKPKPDHIDAERARFLRPRNRRRRATRRGLPATRAAALVRTDLPDRRRRVPHALPGATQTDAKTLGERLCEAARQSHTQGVAVTLSVGIGTPCGADVHFGKLFGAADRALYQAKAEGATGSPAWTEPSSPERSPPVRLDHVTPMLAPAITKCCFVANARVAFANREIPVAARSAGVAPSPFSPQASPVARSAPSYAGNSGISPSPTPHLQRAETTSWASRSSARIHAAIARASERRPHARSSNLRKRSSAISPVMLRNDSASPRAAAARRPPGFCSRSPKEEPRAAGSRLPRLLLLGDTSSEFESRKVLAGCVSRGEPANGLCACFPPYPQQTSYSRRAPKPSSPLRVRSRRTSGRSSLAASAERCLSASAIH